MARCASCDHPLGDDRDHVGARCPHCRDPLYEPAGRVGRPARPGEAACPVHAGVQSVGLCQRCGEQVCEVCRTRWRGKVVCVACVNRALQGREATPEEARTHAAEARRALTLGGLAWVLAAAALAGLALAGSQPPVLLTFAALLVVAANVLVASAGLGQAVAALRTGGDRVPFAAGGLVLGGLYVAAVLGAATLFLWQQ
jgi:hypothetical protein